MEDLQQERATEHLVGWETKTIAVVISQQTLEPLYTQVLPSKSIFISSLIYKM
jgi:hypothetical protein